MELLQIFLIILFNLQKQNTVTNRILNLLYKGVVVAFLGFSLYALTDIVRFSVSDPSGGREYRPPIWPPPPEQRNQKHPKSVMTRKQPEAEQAAATDVTS